MSDGGLIFHRILGKGLGAEKVGKERLSVEPRGLIHLE
jgi:hypothetical protein